MTAPYVVYPILLGAFVVAAATFYIASSNRGRLLKTGGKSPERRCLVLGLGAVVLSVVYCFQHRIAPQDHDSGLAIVALGTILLGLSLLFFILSRRENT